MVHSSCLIDELISPNILTSIFQRLNYIDLVQCQVVSSYWNSLIKDLQVTPTPCLIFPSKELDVRGDKTEFNNNAYGCFLKLGDSQVSNLKRIPKEFRESCCIGSSNGWLIFLEDKMVLSLFHPFKQVKIQLPSLLNPLGFKRFERNPEGNYEIEFLDGKCIVPPGYMFQNYTYLRNIILIKEPDRDIKNFSMIMSTERILHYKGGDSLWTLSPTAVSMVYRCIVQQANDIYALKTDLTIEETFGTDIDIWGFENGSLTKKNEIFASYPENSLVTQYLQIDFDCIKLYLIESCGDILLVARFIGYYEDSNGEPKRVYLRRAPPQPTTVYTYKTLFFHVYRLDIHNKNWVEMDSLGDRALLVGLNHPISVSVKSFSNCESNTIYFTDDHETSLANLIWDNDNMNCGNDNGLYNLKDGRVKPISEFFTRHVLPIPRWIVSNIKP